MWERKSYNVIVPYGIILIIDLFLIITVILNIFLHPEEVNWFKTALEVGLILALVIYYSIHVRNGKSEEEYSIAVDGWWIYPYLEKETAEIKDSIEQRMDLMNRIFNNCMNGAGVGYIMMPVIKYLYNGANNIEELMPVESLHDVPWIYLEIACAIVVVKLTMVQAGYLVSNLIAVSFTHMAQLQLAGLAFSTIEERVTRMMGDWKYNFSSDEVQFEYLAQNEIKSCVKHYQAIYRRTKQMYKINMSIVNYSYYMGCIVTTAIGVVVVKEGNVSFLLLQVICLMVASLGKIFLIAYPMHSIIEKVEAFRVQVYGSSWYNLPLSCQKSVLLMQTTLMYAPKCQTFMGTEVTIDFFAKIINTSYYYITTILSMDIK